jgi:uncharacterized protein (TIGR02118 family)
MIVLFSRKQALSYVECLEYLECEHDPIGENLSGLERFTTAVPIDPARVGHPSDPDGTRYDVMAKLRFESLDDLRAAFASREGRRVLRDAENFVTVDESVMIAVADETLRYRAIPADI